MNDRLENQIESLRNEIIDLRNRKIPAPADWEAAKRNVAFKAPNSMKMRKTLFTKDDGAILAVDFDSKQRLLTLAAGALAAGNALIWNVTTEKRDLLIRLPTPWMMTAKVRTEGRNTIVGIGGLENNLLIYNWDNTLAADDQVVEIPTVKLDGHTAAVSDSCFINMDTAATASGDKLVKIWDIDKQIVKTTLRAHTSDVFSITSNPQLEHLLLSGGSDFTARLFDLRQNQTSGRRAENVFTFDTQSRDVNGVQFFPSGHAFATALNNSTVDLYDVRASCKLATYFSESIFGRTPAEQVVFSPSGRLMFVRYGDNSLYAYDLMKPLAIPDQANPKNFPATASGGMAAYQIDKGEQISCVAVDPTGGCVAAGTHQTGNINSVTKVYWPQKGRAN